MNLSRRSPLRAGVVLLGGRLSWRPLSFQPGVRCRLIDSAVGALAGLGAGPLAHPPYALYLTYVISAWKP